jgi:DNA-directed RNA polymerase subunit beta
VVSEEGQRAEMRDEDDDLLRAAEELGIDLSGVRAADAPAADEEAEVEAEVDAAAEVSIETEDEVEATVDDDDDEEIVADLEEIEIPDVPLVALESEEADA